jgi:ATP-dependent DNA helicase RecG
VYLAVYADRVEIKSPGGFPTSLDLERLYDPPVCDSNPRNPRIARVLYLCKMIETWGRGLGVIARECARVGLPLPVTTVRWGFAVTTFKRPKIDASGSNLDQNLDRADPDPIQIDSYPDGDLARRLLSTIRRNPLISRKLLAVELSVSERKIRDSLKILKDSGVIARQGPDHGGIWRISRRIAPNDVLKTGTSEVINEVIKEAIKNEPGINKPRLVLLVRKSRATVERAIVTLVAAGKIEHRGSKKTGGYYAI